MKDRKVSYNVYAAWEYEREESDLNKKSQEGWQLEKGGCFHSVFRRDETIRYIYQIDYKPDLDDKERYKEIFAEAGWEYINSTYNGWHYFRKKYEEGMDVEEEKIYSDKDSLYEMQNRYVRLISLFAALYLILTVISFTCACINDIDTSDIAEIVGCIVMTFLFGIARINIWRKRNDKKAIMDIPVKILFPIGFILILLATFL